MEERGPKKRPKFFEILSNQPNNVYSRPPMKIFLEKGCGDYFVLLLRRGEF